MRRVWWQVPSLQPYTEERKVTWLELFYDLTYVVLIAQLAHGLTGETSWKSVGTFLLLFLMTWWLWIGWTYYNERFETDGLENRVFHFLSMLSVAAMAVFAHHALSDTANGFALAYAGGRGLIVVLYLRAAIHNKGFRPTAVRLLPGFALSVGLFVVSVWVDPPFKFYLWGAALFAEFIAPPFTMKQQAKLPRFTDSKLPERLGLFTIIVLGESIVGIVSGLAGTHHMTTTTFAQAGMGLALAFSVWWIYFDYVGRRPPRKTHPVWSMFWAYGHMPLAMGIAAFGAGLAGVVGGETGVIEPAQLWVLCGSLAASLTAIGSLEFFLHRAGDEPTHPIVSPALKYVGAAMVLCVPLFMSGMNGIVCMAVMCAAVALQMGYGLYVWFTQDLETSTSPDPTGPPE